MKSYQTTFSIKRLWIILSVGMVVMFGILLLLGQQIYQQAAVLKLMPMNNATQITDDERALIQRWFEAGAPAQ